MTLAQQFRAALPAIDAAVAELDKLRAAALEGEREAHSEADLALVGLLPEFKRKLDEALSDQENICQFGELSPLRAGAANRVAGLTRLVELVSRMAGKETKPQIRAGLSHQRL